MNNLSREFSSLRRLGLAVLLFIAASSAWGQASVTGMNQISSTRVGRTTYDYTYTINVANGSPGLMNAIATVTSSAAATVIVQGSVALGTLAAGAIITSTNTFTLQQDRLVPFNPAALSWTITGTPVDIVPNVVGITQAAAATAIAGAGLVVGTVTSASSSSVPSGNVISQSPSAGASAASGSAVNLTVSTGPAPVTVPNVVGLTQAAASSAITGAGLTVGTVSSASSSSVPSGSVISQSPSAGASAASGSAVNLTVSTGPAPVTVPNVVGLTQAAASAAITGAGLTVGTVTSASSSSVPSGNVISQSPSAGASAASGSAVNLTVSTGPAPVTVPNVVGLTQAAASAAITGAGLIVGTVSSASSSSVPSGSVISQSPSAGASAASGSAVNLTVSTGPASVTVPNVVGLTQAAASAAITGAGLIVGTVSSASSSSVPSGNIISESPIAGATVAAGSAVSVIVSSGPLLVSAGLGYPVIDPEIISAGATTTFTVSSTVRLPNLIPTSVNAQLVDASGNSLAILGALNDGGINGDQVAGDGVYTGTFTLTQPPAGVVYILVSAAQSGAPGTVDSAIASIAVMPIGIPTGFYAPDLSKLDVDPATGSNIVSGEVLACFDAANDPTGVVNAIAASNLVGATLVGRFAGDDNCYQLQLPAGSGPTLVRQAITSLQTLPAVTVAEPDYIAEGSATPCTVSVCSDPSYRLLNYTAALNVSSGTGVVVAVVDTGVDYNVLANVIQQGPRLVQPESQDPMDDNGHGTAMAGIIAGIAPSSQIYAVKALNTANEGPIAALKWGIHYAARHLGVKVINLSWGLEPAGTVSDAISAEIKSAVSRLDCVVVAAAGNNYPEEPNPEFPASYSSIMGSTAAATGVIGVDAVWDSGSASQANDTVWNSSAENADVAAPGVMIVTTSHPGGIIQSPVTGTSPAAAFVSGTAALIKSAYPNWTPSQVATQLLNSVQPLYLLDSTNDVTDQGIGAGRIDPVAALGAIRFTYTGHNQSVSLTTSLSTGIQIVSAGSNSYTLGSFYGLTGQSFPFPPCEGRKSNSCTADESLFNLGAGQYVLELVEADDPPEDASGTITLTVPGLTFVSVQNSATGSIQNSTSASFSLIGGNGTLNHAYFTLQQAAQ